jgi:hypothetical protein
MHLPKLEASMLYQKSPTARLCMGSGIQLATA